MDNAYEWSAVVQWVFTVCAVFGAGVFFRRGEHARTAFTLMMALLVFRAGFSNWERAGREIPMWMFNDRFTLLNNVGLLLSYLMFLMETRHNMRRDRGRS